jgi:hypothetical protein
MTARELIKRNINMSKNIWNALAIITVSISSLAEANGPGQRAPLPPSRPANLLRLGEQNPARYLSQRAYICAQTGVAQDGSSLPSYQLTFAKEPGQRNDVIVGMDLRQQGARSPALQFLVGQADTGAPIRGAYPRPVPPTQSPTSAQALNATPQGLSLPPALSGVNPGTQQQQQSAPPPPRDELLVHESNESLKIQATFQGVVLVMEANCRRVPRVVQGGGAQGADNIGRYGGGRANEEVQVRRSSTIYICDPNDPRLYGTLRLGALDVAPIDVACQATQLQN